MNSTLGRRTRAASLPAGARAIETDTDLSAAAGAAIDATDGAPSESGGTVHVLSPGVTANILIDGAAVGETPYVGRLAAGTHTIVMSVPGSPDDVTNLTIRDGQSLKISAEFPAREVTSTAPVATAEPIATPRAPEITTVRTGSLRVIGVPPGEGWTLQVRGDGSGTIMLDGDPPGYDALAPGEYTVLAARGDDVIGAYVVIRPGEMFPLSFDKLHAARAPEPPPSPPSGETVVVGLVVVHGLSGLPAPQVAIINMDGTPATATSVDSDAPSDSVFAVAPGEYNVHVASTPPLMRRVVVAPGRRVVIDVVPPPPVGAVRVINAPATGWTFRAVPVGEGAVIALSGTPPIASDLPPGRYRIEGRGAGGNVAGEIDVRADFVASVNFSALNPIGVLTGAVTPPPTQQNGLAVSQQTQTVSPGIVIQNAPPEARGSISGAAGTFPLSPVDGTLAVNAPPGQYVLRIEDRNGVRTRTITIQNLRVVVPFNGVTTDDGMPTWVKLAIAAGVIAGGVLAYQYADERWNVSDWVRKKIGMDTADDEKKSAGDETPVAPARANPTRRRRSRRGRKP